MQGFFNVSFEVTKPIQNIALVNLLTDCDKSLAKTSAYDISTDDSITYCEAFDESIAVSGYIDICGYCEPEEAESICHMLNGTAESYGLECDYVFDNEIYSDAELNRRSEKW